MKLGKLAKAKAKNGQMTDNLQPRSGISYWLTVIGKWWVGAVALLFVLGTVMAAIISLLRFLSGNPDWGIVMLPEVLVFAILLCLPGAALFALGWLLKLKS